jgi:hypothetical protein
MWFGWAACHLRLDTAERRRRKIQPIDKRIDEAHWVVRIDIVNRLRQQQNLRSVVAREVRHARFYRVVRRAGIRSVRLFHTVCPACAPLRAGVQPLYNDLSSETSRTPARRRNARSSERTSPKLYGFDFD